MERSICVLASLHWAHRSYALGSRTVASVSVAPSGSPARRRVFDWSTYMTTPSTSTRGHECFHISVNLPRTNTTSKALPSPKLQFVELPLLVESFAKPSPRLRGAFPSKCCPACKCVCVCVCVCLAVRRPSCERQRRRTGRTIND
jgi:hypothetical protein